AGVKRPTRESPPVAAVSGGRDWELGTGSQRRAAVRPVPSSAPSSVPHPSPRYLCSSESAATGDCGAGRSCSPIWSCSVWGLPCLGHRCPSGALLPGAPTKGPHLFTLTRPGSRLPGREPGGMFSVALSVSEAYGPREHPPPTLAVSEHTALRSSD